MTRTCALGLAALAPALALCGPSGEATDAVRWAFQSLAAERSIRVRLDGVEHSGKAQTPFISELYWHLSYGTSNQLTAKVEHREWREGVLKQRTVGDGVSLFSYTPQRNEYWVSRYGSHGPATPTRYLANLVDDFTAGMRGSATLLGRLLREVYAAGGFRPWIPGASEFLAARGAAPVHDPVVEDRVYAPNDDTEFAMFWIGNPARKSLVFEFDLRGPSGRTLRRIYFAEFSIVGGRERLVDWSAEVFTNFVPASDDFVFVPPPNARPIVGPRPSIG